MRSCRFQYRLGIRPAFEELVNLAHRDAGIRAHRQERRSRRLYTVFAGHAEEVPDSVLDIVGVDGAVELELQRAGLERTRVILGDASLPELRLDFGSELDDAIEIRERRGVPA